MPLMHLVPFFMHSNLKRTSKWILELLCFSLEETPKEKKILQVCFSLFLLTKCMNSSTIQKFPIPMFSFTICLNQWRFQQAIFNRLKRALKKCFCTTTILDQANQLNSQAHLHFQDYYLTACYMGETIRISHYYMFLCVLLPA